MRRGVFFVFRVHYSHTWVWMLKKKRQAMSLLLLLLLLIATTTAWIFVPNVDRGPERKVHAIAVRTPQGQNPRELAKRYGFHYAGQIVPGYHLLERPIDHRNRSLDKLSEEVEWMEEQTPLERVKRTVSSSRIPDPLWPEQWHLHGGTGGYLPNVGHVQELWDQGVDGRGTTIAIVDDGLQHRHPDIAPNYRASRSRDVSYGRDDPTPHNRDSHGTAAAGVAAASRNNVCGVGVAPRAGLAGLRILAGYPTDSREAIGLSYKCDEGNDIFSNSWGPVDNGLRLEGPGHLTAEAMRRCVELGRGRKGAIYVWAGGNGRHFGDDVNNDGYASSRFTIAVAAVTDQGRHADYSEPGASLLCAAPSSGGTRRITSTDLLGDAGSSYTDCTRRFGGTSAACPMVAGIVALMLQVNHRLGWRDVQHVLIRSCNKTDVRSESWTSNGAGLWHSHDYGFGIPDARRAVAIARQWTNVPTPATIYTSGKKTLDPPLDVVVGEEKAVTWDCPSGPYRSFFIEHVEVSVVIHASSGRGAVQIVLCSPAGTCSILSRASNGDPAERIDWTYTSLRQWGEGTKGEWKLRVRNADPEPGKKRDPRNGGIRPVYLYSWQIWAHGYRIPGTY